MIWTINFRKIDILTHQQSSMLSIISKNTSAILFTCDTWSICIFVSAPECDCSSGMSFGSGRSRNILQHPANGGAACGSIAEVQNCSNECVDWPLAGCVMVCSHWIRGFVHLSSTFLSFCTVKATCSFSCLTVLTLQRSCIVLLSYLQGQWGSWGSWSSCPVSCGGSTQNRSRIQPKLAVVYPAKASDLF